MSSALVSSVNDESFEKEVLESDKLILVDFWAEWCGPCRMLSPILDEVATSMKEKVKIVKLNVDESPSVATTYNIRGIPTMILFKDGKVISTKASVLPKSKIEEWILDNA